MDKSDMATRGGDCKWKKPTRAARVHLGLLQAAITEVCPFRGRHAAKILFQSTSMPSEANGPVRNSGCMPPSLPVWTGTIDVPRLTGSIGWVVRWTSQTKPQQAQTKPQQAQTKPTESQ